jgi:hypothetical protein
VRLVAGVVRVTADLERIVKYAFRISPMLGSCSFDFGIWIVAPDPLRSSVYRRDGFACSMGGYVSLAVCLSSECLRRGRSSHDRLGCFPCRDSKSAHHAFARYIYRRNVGLHPFDDFLYHLVCSTSTDLIFIPRRQETSSFSR